VKGCVLQKACHLQTQPLETCTWGSKIKYYIIHIIAKGTFHFAKKLKQESFLSLVGKQNAIHIIRFSVKKNYLPKGKIFSIQGDSGGNVSTLGVDSMGHCEKKFRMNMCLILNCYRYRDVWIYKYQSIANNNKEETLLTANCILISI
jgi:hypothetical protein